MSFEDVSSSLQSISCPHCAGSFLYDGSAAGTPIDCPHCSQVFTLPGERAPAFEGQDPSLELHYEVAGQHPVQVEGTIQGHPFYFRAKWDFWTFTASISDANPELPSWMNPPEDKPGFFRDLAQEGYYLSEHWGTGTEAGTMPLDVVDKIIRDCACKLIDALRNREDFNTG